MKRNLTIQILAVLVAMGMLANAFPVQADSNDTKSKRPTMPLIGDDAPAFKATTTQGEIRFPDDYKGKWVVLFSHPADFTPVCTTEFMSFATKMPQFNALNTELIGLSIDSNYSHIAWVRTIKEKIEYKGMKNVDIKFPVIADLKMDVAGKYGMVQPKESDTHAVRAVFIIDPKAKVRAVLYYPLSNGRNVDEIKRLLIAMQTSDKFAVATPADWQPGEDVIVPPPDSCGIAADRVTETPKDTYVLDWFMTLRKLPKEQLALGQQSESRHTAIVSDKLEPYQCGTVQRLHTYKGVFLASQPSADDFEQAKKGGVKSVINLRRAEENKDFDEAKVVGALGLTYHNPGWNGPDELTDAKFDEVRRLLRKAKRPILLHCSSANRVGPMWLAYRVLDEGATVEQAVQEARIVGMRSPDYETKALNYIRRQQKQ